MLSLTSCTQPGEALLILLVVAFIIREIYRASSQRKFAGRVMHNLRHLRSARVAVAVVLACTDVLFALAVMVFVLFSGTLSSDEVDVESEGAALGRRARGSRPEDVLAELRQVLQSSPKRASDVVSDLVEDLTAHFELDVLDAVLAALPTLPLDPDDRAHEVLLEAHLALGNFHEVRSLAARLGARPGSLTPRMQRARLDTALETACAAEAVEILCSADDLELRASDRERLVAIGVDPAEIPRLAR